MTDMVIMRPFASYSFRWPGSLVVVKLQAEYSCNLLPAYPLASGATFQNNTRPSPRLARHISQAFAS